MLISIGAQRKSIKYVHVEAQYIIVRIRVSNPQMLDACSQKEESDKTVPNLNEKH